MSFIVSSNSSLLIWASWAEISRILWAIFKSFFDDDFSPWLKFEKIDPGDFHLSFCLCLWRLWVGLRNPYLSYCLEGNDPSNPETCFFFACFSLEVFFPEYVNPPHVFLRPEDFDTVMCSICYLLTNCWGLSYCLKFLRCLSLDLSVSSLIWSLDPYNVDVEGPKLSFLWTLLLLSSGYISKFKT